MSFLKSFFGGQEIASDKTASAVDAVAYVASLASDPKAIDALMEPLREITSTLKPGAPLTPAQQTALVGVYKKLQDYLVTSDPLRHFEASELQQKVRQKFPKTDAKEAQFWGQISPPKSTT